MGLTKVSYAMINGAPFNVLDYGAKGDGSTDDQPAIQAAIDAATVAGGTVYIPAGTYKLEDGLVIQRPNISVRYWTDVYIQGDGAGATILECNDVPADTDGILVKVGTNRFGIDGLTVQNATRNGIYINDGTDPNAFCSRFYINNVICDKNGAAGFRLIRCYMGEFDNLEATNNETAGFYLGGFHTSLTFNRCWAGGDAVYPNGGNNNVGWYIGNITYSTFTSCASDWNKDAGYLIENTAGVTFQSCGAESNDNEGFLVKSGSPSSITGKTDGLSFVSCFAFNNAKSDKTLYANFLGALTADSTNLRLSLYNCTDLSTDGNDYSVVLNGTSGIIVCDINNSQFQEEVFKSGSVNLFNYTLAGRVATPIITAPVSIPNATDTLLPFTSFFTNEINATLSAGKLVIPQNVNRVRVTAGVGWDTAASGSRYISLRYNGNTFYGNGQQEQSGVGYVFQTTVSALIDVTAGGEISLIVNQDSGAALNVLGLGISTYMQIEVIG